MLGHPATLRAFPAISHRFLRACAHLTGYGADDTTKALYSCGS